jgi:acetyltransferase-like isoleucine patch superfamily enzyme
LDNIRAIGVALKLPQGRIAKIVVDGDVSTEINYLVLKGVTIGQSYAIGASSVVSMDVPPNVVVAGNPVRVVRELPSGKS